MAKPKPKPMSESERTAKRVQRMLHSAHMRFQREALAHSVDASTLIDGSVLPSTAVRGVRERFVVPQWLAEQRAAQLRSVCSGLRGNFWKAYFDTLMYLGK